MIYLLFQLFRTNSLIPSSPSSIAESIFARFLSLGITAAISITVGSVVIFVVCTVCIVCCCCRCMRRKPQDAANGSPSCAPNHMGANGGGSSHGGSMVNGPHPTTAATSVTINNGAPPTVSIPRKYYSIICSVWYIHHT